MPPGAAVLPSAFGSSASGNGGGIIGGMQPAGGRASWANSAQNSSTSPFRSRDSRVPLPYIKDLQDEAAHLEVNETSSVFSTHLNGGLVLLLTGVGNPSPKYRYREFT
jgi:ubiquitin carboxyl-terminal hydrolase 8